MTTTKQLPRDASGQIKREFKANGHKYIILTPKEAFTPHRHNWLEKLTNEWIFGCSPEDFAGKCNGIGARMMQDGHDPQGRYFITTQLYSLQAGMLNRSKQKYARSLYMAALFINRKGEDIRNWTMEAAKEKIEDWNNEGYTADDFFLLSTQLLTPITERLKKDLKELPQTATPYLESQLENTASSSIMENLKE